MSELEKAIDQKLANARKQCDKGGTAAEKSTGNGESKKIPESKIKKEKEEPKKSSDGDRKEDPKKSSGGEKKDEARKPSGSDRKDDAKRGNDRRDDQRRGHGRDDGRSGTSSQARKPSDGAVRNGASSKSTRADDSKRESKPEVKKNDASNKSKNPDTNKKGSDKDKVEKRSETAKPEIKKEPEETPAAGKKDTAGEPSTNPSAAKKKKKKVKVKLTDGVDWDITRDYGTNTEAAGEDEDENNEPDWADIDNMNSRDRERSFEPRRDHSPTPPWSTRNRGPHGPRSRYGPPGAGRPRVRSRTRSPVAPRIRTRSPVPRRRSRSPYGRRSPSNFSRYNRGESRRFSPRRSRSPVRRRSRSRSRYERSRSTERRSQPKALLAKKSFLDDLAVKFAQEGKEFPELEQYRCEINSQFGSQPRQAPFVHHGLQHAPDCGTYMGGPPPMMMPMMPTSVYNVHPTFPMPPAEFCEPPMNVSPVVNVPPIVNVPPLVSYPIAGALQTAKPDKPSVPFPSLETIMPENKVSPTVAVSDLLLNKKSSLGTQPEPVLEKGSVLQVKARITQAVELLDGLASTGRKSGKFMYRSQSYYENGINENRSPVMQGPCNPLFAFSRPPGESNDPFGNVPKNVKAVVSALCLDEGRISEKIYLRRKKALLEVTLKKKRQELEERKRRAMMANKPKALLQKTTQTDPTVCTECLIRKLKFRATAETQTPPTVTVESAVQTNPMPVQTVSEFGSITELTPNQVRAVSELIRYIKLTATSGSVEEMRSSMLADQVYNVNSDLRTAYQYFDGMVQHKNHARTAAAVPPEVVEPPINEDLGDPDDIEQYDDDRNSIDEYEEFHKNFCGDEMNEENQYMFDQNEYDEPDDSLQQNPLAPFGSVNNYPRYIGGPTTARGAAPPRGKSARGRGRGQNNARGSRGKMYNRR